MIAMRMGALRASRSTKRLAPSVLPEPRPPSSVQVVQSPGGSCWMGSGVKSSLDIAAAGLESGEDADQFVGNDSVKDGKLIRVLSADVAFVGCGESLSLKETESGTEIPTNQFPDRHFLFGGNRRKLGAFRPPDPERGLTDAKLPRDTGERRSRQ